MENPLENPFVQFGVASIFAGIAWVLWNELKGQLKENREQTTKFADISREFAITQQKSAEATNKLADRLDIVDKVSLVLNGKKK